MYIWCLSGKSPAIVNITRVVWGTLMEAGSQGEWTEMHVLKQWRLHCTSQWGRWTPLSEYVHCVAIAFKMTEWVEQWICIKFCVKLKCSSLETIQMLQKATAMGNWWWLAPSSGQCTCSHITSPAVFWQNVKSPTWLSLSIAQNWHPVSAGFSQN